MCRKCRARMRWQRRVAKARQAARDADAARFALALYRPVPPLMEVSAS
ncbi:hypothetical protein CLV72_105519 [Allonocardiopsis opalescens]|uniref:Uncharacterized protein n=1 Tax=Allonocardiopsis opalescens TaxID=1144618 RepID=A0A2T0Q300_9ACTN|nr:hypothetical protein CLV72_105519 [Allonocardiopsis opalescens]